jgi:geranylgeranyl diphosphate synthase, type II
VNDAAYRKRIDAHRARVERRLAKLPLGASACDLELGCRYVLRGGGKRIRSTIVLLACEAVGGRAARALDAAVAVEVMHNFTLVHDDIMDNADARRGRPTVHTRWNLNTALLVGDVLLGAAYASLLRSAGDNHRAMGEVFTRGLLEVCDGQGLDMEFESRERVTTADYFRMIDRKTGALLATAAEIGGIAGNASPARCAALHAFGLRLGRAFQLQDDLLDVVADPDDFGKTVGGDILEGKKTFLLLEAARRAAGTDRDLIINVMRRDGPRAGWKNSDGSVTPDGAAAVAEVAALYQRTGVIDETRRRVRRATGEALEHLRRVPDNAPRQALAWLAGALITRGS